VSLGFYSYPVSQAADILIAEADLVPVGDDQLPHIELTREIVRKFNAIYGETFKEPKELLGRIPRLMGIDGKAKASKSLNNAVFLSDSPEEVEKKVKKMYTDPTRIHATDPGHIEGNVVFSYLDAFYTNKPELEEMKENYKAGKLKDIEVKDILTKTLNNFLDPIREKRAYYLSHFSEVEEAIKSGTERAKISATRTMSAVRKAMQITDYEKLGEQKLS
jgi:tryptophanyl-tRNA synthetase